MQNREFEKKVQQKMEELKLAPSDLLWGKVEAALPAEKKPRRWILFFLLAAVLFTGGLLLKQYLITGNNKYAANDTEKIVLPVILGNETVDAPGKNDKAKPEAQPLLKDSPPAKEAMPGAAMPATGRKAARQTVINGNARTALRKGDVTDASTGKNSEKSLNTKARVKIKVKAPQPAMGTVADEDERVTDTVLPAAVSKYQNNTDAVLVTPRATDSIPKKDTAAAQTVAAKLVKVKAIKKTNWQYGVYVSLGRAAVNNAVFSNHTANNSPFYSAAFNQTGAGAGNNYLPAAPEPGTAFAIGFSAEKNINARWKIVTGIHYLYQSNFIWVGKKVDSAVTIAIDANKSITAGNYYRVGYDQKHKNNFHSIEVPLLLQYRPLKKLPVYIEGGFTVSVLLQSDALLFNTAGYSFVSDPALFTRLQFAANAGAGFNTLQKTKFPLSIGFRLRQGLVSYSKPAFGKQYFSYPVLYARLNLKK